MLDILTSLGKVFAATVIAMLAIGAFIAGLTFDNGPLGWGGGVVLVFMLYRFFTGNSQPSAY